MPWPSSLTLVTLSVQVDVPPSGGAGGWFTFTTPGPLLGETFVAPFSVRMELDADGAGSVQLPATDDPQWSPVGWEYTVRGRVNGQSVNGTVQLSYLSVSADLADLFQPDGTAEQGVSYLLTSRRGVAGGVAGLDSDGDVIDADGEKVGGAEGTLLAANNLSDVASAATARGNLGAVAKAGDTFTGDVVVADNATATKAYRLKVTGGALDFDAAAQDLYLSTYPNADFTGAQNTYARFQASSRFAQLMGRFRFAVDAFDGAGVADLDSGTGVAGVGLKNGLTNVRMCGFKASAGAPTSGTWTEGDAVLAADGRWHLCTGGGTPGTWTSPGSRVAHATVTSGNLSPQNTSAAWATVTGSPTISIAAAAGDYVELSILSMLTAPNLNQYLDLAVMVGGSAVRYASNNTATPAAEGLPGLYRDISSFLVAGVGFGLTVQAGDLSAGTVSIVIATNGTGGGTIYASPTYPLTWRLLNHGPAA